ncbi:hypothetical protein BUALT_Bualt04G0111500 [Buddleja alternifolia]|uniref:F-box domain-containing protein n=1 Tax=Buddleja alternifolia TaxID=168488 RepID=A0AAV6XN28_9LAMI|nr:hypothetical protein BUALT_Bualt04G0111500 [Buddleja alternifolia]
MTRRKEFKLKMPKRKHKIPAAEVASSSAPPPPWADLPIDVTANILHRLGAIDILENAEKVCTTWRRVCRDPGMWRVINMKNSAYHHDMLYNLDIMCRHAVDRSEGQLIDINIEYFGTDYLLHYICGRSSKLRRLRLACCYDISGEGLLQAVKRIPQLEELRLFFMKSILAEDIEAIGLSCPMLKSFTFNVCRHKYPRTEDNEYALAVAKNMPNLRQLRLFGNKMSNEGLKAILESCPHLELLDLRQCFSVDLGGDLGRICSQRVKVLKRPYDSTDDFEWDGETCRIELCSDGCYSPGIMILLLL